MRNTEHLQVPFVTVNGTTTKVDEGMFDILTELKRLGVDTHYSCQGGTKYDNDRAYVLGSGKTFLPVLTKLLYRRYRHPSSRYVRNFTRGHRCIEISYFTGKGTYVKPLQTLGKLRFGLGDDDIADFRVTLMYSNAFGFRVSIRWPKDETKNVIAMLNDI